MVRVEIVQVSGYKTEERENGEVVLTTIERGAIRIMNVDVQLGIVC